MAVWYRAHRSQKIAEVFSGDGGLYAAGRWNYMGNKAVYCSESIALCTLEWLSHHGLSISGFNYFRYSINVPDKLTVTLSPGDLPRNWLATPATDETRDVADEILFHAKKYLALAVPSVVVPEEYNLIMNPLHTGFETVVKTVRELGKHSVPRR